MSSRYALAAGVMALAALVVSACVVEVTPHGAGVYSVRPVTLQAAPDVTPTPEVVQTPTPTPDAPPVGCFGVVATTVRLNVRSGPGTDYDVVNSVNPDAVVQIIGSADGWYQIATPPGWVSGLWVVLSEVAACDPFGL